MTTLKNLKGTAIQFLDEDPVVYAGSWSSGGSLNTARKDAGSFGAGATNGIAAGGYGGAPAAAGNYVESYNGTSWTETTELNAGRGWSPMGAGTQTAGLVAGGQPLPPASGYTAITEEWNGSAWTESGDLNIARANLAGTGSQTAAVAFGGSNPGGPGPAASIDTENYNGTSWTETANMNSAASSPKLHSRGSPYTSVISVHSSNTESWNGSAWTEVAEVNSSRTNGAGAGESNTSAVIFGGSSQNAKTESWNGTSWTEVNDLSTGRADGGTTGGTASNALYAGGETTVYVGTTEEWSFPPATASTLNEGDMWFNSSSSTLKGYGKAGNEANGTWASGDSLNTARDSGGFFGSKNAALLAGGVTPGSNTLVEEYDGSSWTEVNDTPVTGQSSGGFGTQTAGLITGAGNPPAPAQSTLTYDGTNWTAVANLNTARYTGGAFGTQSSGIYAGGYAGSLPGTANAESWNGTTWTEVSDLNDDRWKIAGAGTSGESGLVVGGYSGPVTNTANTEKWDGSSWTEVNNLNSGRSGMKGGGTVTSALVFGGGPFSPGPQTNLTENWDGTSWTEVADMAIKRENSGATTVGTAVGTMAVGGNSNFTSPNPTALTEDWNVDSGVVTVTTS